MTIKEMSEYVGGLSRPSKMPFLGYSITAKECGIGSQLRQVEGSVCFGCYALQAKSSYMRYPAVQPALYRRLEAISKPLWVEYMAALINHHARNKDYYFRWHDSGDIQSVNHLHKICEVARLTPNVKHWLPTREYRIVKHYLANNTVPENLNIRLSAHMIDGPAPKVAGMTTSTVHTDNPQGHVCPAPKQGNVCGDCRACWNPSVQNVSYHIH